VFGQEDGRCEIESIRGGPTFAPPSSWVCLMALILETKSLTKRFGGLTAVDGVNLRLDGRELRCIIGPNGCGKTTLFNLISGFYKPSSGEVLYEGTNITGKSVYKISELGIGRKFQVPSVFSQLTVYENMRVPFFFRHRLFDSHGSENSHLEIMELLEQIKLADKREEIAINLAHGEKQWLEIGMVLASRPKLMLLDEPTAGMTVGETSKTARLICEISQQTGISILVIEHDISFVKEIASRITVMYKGNIFKEGSYEEIQTDEEVREIYLGRQKRNAGG
jgi:urea transport system ATP-binding protein